MRTLRAVILHRHTLFRDLLASILGDLGPVEVVAATTDVEAAFESVVACRPDALVIEAHEGFIDRKATIDLFCRAAAEVEQLSVIAVDLSTSRIEVLHDSIEQRDHLRGLEQLLHHQVVP